MRGGAGTAAFPVRRWRAAIRATERDGSLAMLRADLEEALRASGWFVLGGDPDACDYILRGEHRAVRDGRRTTHRVTVRLHDTAGDFDAWSGSDEIAKE